MRYSEIFKFPLVIILFIIISIVFIILFLRSAPNIILISKINNNDISVELNIKYMFNLININKQLYPPKNNKLKKNKKNKKEDANKNIGKFKLAPEDILTVYRALRKIKIYEFYSKVDFGTKNIKLTSFIHVLINIIYGNLVSLITPQKIYLGVNPSFVQEYILVNIKIHIKPTIRDLIYVIIASYKIYKKNKSSIKEGDNNESDGVNTESYGNNS